MVVVVLTGGIGSGKSVAAELFRGRGAVVIDLDAVAAGVMGPGSPVLSAVSAEFGERVVRADGSLDREALARCCFADSATSQRLDAIVHPAVSRKAVTMLAEMRSLSTPPSVVIVEVPLLAEAPEFAELGDVVVAITAPEAIRVERAVSRGMERSDVLRRTRVQAPDSARVALADVVIDNGGSLEGFLLALSWFWDQRFGPGAQSG